MVCLSQPVFLSRSVLNENFSYIKDCKYLVSKMSTMNLQQQNIFEEKKSLNIWIKDIATQLVYLTKISFVVNFQFFFKMPLDIVKKQKKISKNCANYDIIILQIEPLSKLYSSELAVSIAPLFFYQVNKTNIIKWNS